jgi:hypothetical protein
MKLPQATVLACHYCCFDYTPDNGFTEEQEEQREYVAICCGKSVCLYHINKGHHAHVKSSLSDNND